MESSHSSSTIPFKSNKPLFTTPIKTTTTTTNNNTPPPSGPAVATPERANPNPSTRIRNQNYALSVSDVRRIALQLHKPNLAHSGSDKAVPEKFCPTGFARNPNGSKKRNSPCLPLKYEMLCKFFDSMISSIRLLQLKKQPSTLSKLARSIESLTDRRFTLHHLAQLKYILPEVIVVKKFPILDEVTKCMKEDLLVSLKVDAVETVKNAKGGNGYSQLKEIFQSRVVDFSKSHDEDVDVPEGELPNLFYQPKQESESNMNKTSTPLAASPFAPSFKRRFSSRPLGAPVIESMAPKPTVCLSETPVKDAACAEADDVIEADVAHVDLDATPAKPASIPSKHVSTPAELVSTPARLMAATPALHPPKRSLMSPDHDTRDVPTNRSAKRRSLNFDESSVDIEDQQGFSVSKDDILEVLPEDLLQSLIEKEKKSLEEKDPIALQARRRQQLMAGVPKLFDMISLLFQSIRRSVITKEELIYKLLTGHMDIVDRSEVEEQLKLLQEVAPEYISEQQSLSGDTLFRLNKSSCSESIRAKLLAAK